MKTLILFTIQTLLLICHCFGQTVVHYTTAQAHSHNDYEQKRPFSEAFEQKFGSIEADLFLVNDTLYAAHNLRDITRDRTFSRLYLTPILDKISKNNGRIYGNGGELQLLIDLKTSSKETLAALVKLLEPHKNIFVPSGSVKIVISGNTPAPADFDQYPSYIFIDGRPEITYTDAQLTRIGLISQAFQKYSSWNGEGDLPERDKKKIAAVVENIHSKGKKVRFWATPDNINTWKTMMSLKVDFLNTDHVVLMGDYLSSHK